LEEKRAELGVDSYGLAVTTLEEVFLAVSAAASAEAKPAQPGRDAYAAAAAASGGDADGDSVKVDLPMDDDGRTGAAKGSEHADTPLLTVRVCDQVSTY
jgi:hypothetical protein